MPSRHSFIIEARRSKETMKFLITYVCAALVYYTDAWVFPRGALQKAASIATVSAVIAASPMNALAADFSGSYSDPKHPNCQRVVEVKGSEAFLKGTDGNPGCPPDGSGKAWKLTGKVDGDTILVDFTPKGGPPGLKGEWDGSSPAGIKWPDGNKWTVKN